MFGWLKRKIHNIFLSAEEKKKKEFLRLQSIPDKTAEDCANLAWHYINNSQVEESQQWFNRSMELDPQPRNAGIYYLAANIQEHLGDYPKAIEFRQKAISLTDSSTEPDAVRAMRYLLSCDYLCIGDAQLAQNTLNYLVENTQPDMFVIEQYLNTMIHLGDFTKCLPFLQNQLRKYPDNQEILCALGKFYYQYLFDPGTARKYFDQVASIEFKSLHRNKHLDYEKFFEELMWSILLAGEMESAKDIVEFAYSKRRIDRHEYLVILMYYYSEIEDIPAMDRVIRQLNKIQQPCEYATISKVDVLLDHDRGGEILEEITRLYQQQPDNIEIACAYVKLLISRIEYDKAERIITDISRINPSSEQMAIYKGIHDFALGNYQSALNIFTRIGYANPYHREPRMAAAVCHKKLGHSEEVRQILAEIHTLPLNYEFHPDIITAFSEEFPGEYSPDTYLI